MHRAYRYRFYPTPEQAQQLARTFWCARYVYNWALALRSTAWSVGKERINYHETARRLTLLKQHPDTAWLQEVSNVALQQSLRHLDKGFMNHDPAQNPL